MVSNPSCVRVSDELRDSLGSSLTAQTVSPTVGQPGKDVVWVPTPPALVETMLDLAKSRPTIW